MERSAADLEPVSRPALPPLSTDRRRLAQPLLALLRRGKPFLAPARRLAAFDRAHPTLTFAAAAVLFCLWCALLDAGNPPIRKLFWDAHVYTRALHDLRTGADPYALTDLPFVNPPLLLALLRPLAAVPPILGFPFYLLLQLAAVLAVPWLAASVFLQHPAANTSFDDAPLTAASYSTPHRQPPASTHPHQPRTTPHAAQTIPSHGQPSTGPSTARLTPATALLLFAFLPGHFGPTALLSGNLTNLLNALLLLAALPGLRQNRWLTFHAATILAAALKPTFLAFLLLPLLAAGRRQLRAGILTTLLTAAVYLAQLLLVPQLFHAFTHALHAQLAVRLDAGFGLLFWLLVLTHLVPALARIPLPILFAALLAPLLALLLRLRPRLAGTPLWLPLLLVTITLSNPRLQVYDVDLATLPALFLLLTRLRTQPLTPLILLSALPLALLHLLFPIPTICLVLCLALTLPLTPRALTRPADYLPSSTPPSP